MLLHASVPASSASTFVPKQSISCTCQIQACRNAFLSSSEQSHRGIVSHCRRNVPNLSKSLPDPIPFALVSSLHPDSTDTIGKQELRRDFYREAMACDGDFEIEVIKVGGKKNRRMIQSRVRVDADLSTVWRVLTDYEGLSTFIPSLAVCQLLEKRGNFARLYQVGVQYLGLGLKFNAKGVLDCYEGDLRDSPTTLRRDIEFRMVEGDFQTYEGKWSIEQVVGEECEDGDLLTEKEYQTTLSYIVELEPKLWIPVRLLEGRVCREVKVNILCIRDEAQRIQKLGSKVLTSWKTDADLTKSSNVAD